MRLNIKVKPNSFQEKIEKINDNSYEVWLKTKPIDNKANVELLKILKKKFKTNFNIKYGHTSRNKVVESK